MKKLLRILANHTLLLLSVFAILCVDLIAILLMVIFKEEEFVAVWISSVVGILFIILLVPFSAVYAVLFFRKENFLTPLLPLGLIILGKTGIFPVSAMSAGAFFRTKLALIPLLICLFVRITAIILIRIYKEKLQSFTGEEKVTSDAVFWARVLFRHN